MRLAHRNETRDRSLHARHVLCTFAGPVLEIDGIGGQVTIFLVLAGKGMWGIAGARLAEEAAVKDSSNPIIVPLDGYVACRKGRASKELARK